MLLTIDCGNTNTLLGLFSTTGESVCGSHAKGRSAVAEKNNKLIYHYKFSTCKRKSVQTYITILKNFLAKKNVVLKDLEGIALSNVVPSLSCMWKDLFRKVKIKPLWINSRIKLPFKIKIKDPRQLGADIIAGAAGAVKKYPLPLIVIDFGTATTFCAISRKKEILGGAISIGLKLSAKALYQNVPHLPKIKLVRPKSIIGKDTVSAMQAGIFSGYLFLIEGIIEEFAKFTKKDCLVIATGGLAPVIFKNSSLIDKLEPSLTLEGLNYLYKLNS